MCFVTDSDWYAEETSECREPATAACKCDECFAPIAIGETYYYLWQQQYEQCHDCEYSDCACPKDSDGDCLNCQCEPPNYGEQFEYRRCLQCDKFLQSVETAEVASGCSVHESRPYLLGMREDISNGGMDEAKKYFKTAQRLYPELVASGYLGKLWRRMFS